MLSALRKKHVAKRIIWVLAIIIIPAFVLWGAGNLGKRRRGLATIGFVGERKVTVEDFLEYRRGVQLVFLLQFYDNKEELDKIFEDRMLLNKLAWDNIVMLEEAKKRKVRVTNEEVVDFVTSQRLFNSNGTFDERFYNYMLRRNLNMNPRTFEEEIRRQLKISKLKESVIKPITVSEEEVRQFYALEFEKGIISYVILERDKYKSQVQVSQQEIEDYYVKFKNEFKILQKSSFQYIEFPYKDADEKAALIETIKEALEGLKTKAGGFDSIAKDFNKETQETGLFSIENLPPKLNWSGDVYRLIFTMEIGQMRVIIDEGAEGNIYILRIKEKLPARLMTEKEALPLIKEMFIKGKSEKIARDNAIKLYGIIKNKKNSLEEAALSFGLTTNKTEFIARADYLEEVGEAYDILDSIFKKEVGVISHPFETRKGFMLARLDAFQKIDEKKLEEEKEEYRKKVLTSKKAQALQKWFTNISKDAQLIVDPRRL
ncbi:MAG: SurA N-terminal domain-containing protein [Candidatus Omnitrophica bacterium]|nr:SurA N-terminal domain-containing protein [Candidatus Omnitrophota bacterium]